MNERIVKSANWWVLWLVSMFKLERIKVEYVGNGYIIDFTLSGRCQVDFYKGSGYEIVYRLEGGKYNNIKSSRKSDIKLGFQKIKKDIIKIKNAN